MSSCKIDVSGWGPEQLEIEYFFPLTEQVALDLDYTPCHEYSKKQMQSFATGTTISNLAFLPTGTNATIGWANISPFDEVFNISPKDSVGCWKVTSGVAIHRKTKPNLLHRIFTKLALGWEWKDK